ncbi:hypothetical protein [Amycolatopsis sp. NPDC059021]|uniref:hypothetical protein n=1 Tax=Amycolatopsis sp. NPDC059021 TaxID=3346704 RepID=UPI00366ACEDB
MIVTRAAAPRHRSILLLLIAAFFLFADATPELPGGPGDLTAKAAVVQQTVPQHVVAHPIPPVDVPRETTVSAARQGFGEVLPQHTPVIVRRPAHAAEARAPPAA